MKGSSMSINPVTGAGATQTLAAARPQGPERGEVPGTPDQDHDGDETVARTAPVQSPSPTPGHLDVKA